VRRRIRRRELEPGIRLAAAHADRHALPAREVHHRGVLGQAMHEQRALAPVARMDLRALEQRAADALAAMAGKHRHAELHVTGAARKMRRAEEAKLVVEHAERGVVLEVDARQVIAHRVVADGDAEAQPPILCLELEEVLLEDR
jgi:hypothetical protein